MNNTGKIAFNEISKEIPELLQEIENYLQHSELTTEELELIRLKSSEINACQFCTDMHLKIAKKINIPIRKIDEITNFENSDAFSELEKNILRLTVNLAATMKIDFDLQQKIIDERGKAYTSTLLFAISQINTWNRIAKSCGL